ncbi:hypothetical protein [Kordiimonas lacus]|uniref:Uncharacterized protein n=1 Tax=Kordiimonas lacus TaxID=637679 RepID=A0A1G6YSB7_9PROT|nr:hypothetical protein [Kordiimonas lacus]SDD93258.1 hypothetical protein SAMN04488071_1727 [Kordiimonas lacus]
MHPAFRKVIKWLAALTLYGFAFFGLFVAAYHGLGFSTDTDTHRVAIINETKSRLTDVKITIGRETYSTNNIGPSATLSFVAVNDTEGALGFSATLEGRKIGCSFGYITTGTYDFDLSNTHAMFWVQPDGGVRVSYGTWHTDTAPTLCGQEISAE